MNTDYIPAADILYPVALATEGVTLVPDWLPNWLGYPSPTLIRGDYALSMDEGGADDAGVMVYVWSEFTRDGEEWEPADDGSGYEDQARAAALDWAERIA